LQKQKKIIFSFSFSFFFRYQKLGGINNKRNKTRAKISPVQTRERYPRSDCVGAENGRCWGCFQNIYKRKNKNLKVYE
jgi:hypothetical protein